MSVKLVLFGPSHFNSNFFVGRPIYVKTCLIAPDFSNNANFYRFSFLKQFVSEEKYMVSRFLFQVQPRTDLCRLHLPDRDQWYRLRNPQSIFRSPREVRDGWCSGSGGGGGGGGWDFVQTSLLQYTVFLRLAEQIFLKT